MDYLQERAPLCETQNGQNRDVNDASSSGTLNRSLQPVKRFRRASIASCNNMFQVAGQTIEVGFDYLKRVPRTNAVIGVIGVQTVQQKIRDVSQVSRNLEEPGSSGTSAASLGTKSAGLGQEEKSSHLQYSGQSDSCDSYSGEDEIVDNQENGN